MQESEGSDECPSEDNFKPEKMNLLLPERQKSLHTFQLIHPLRKKIQKEKLAVYRG